MKMKGRDSVGDRKTDEDQTCRLDDVMQGAPFVGVHLFGFAPNSGVLNPIERVWIEMKSKVKSD